jgi:hypothetical protein
LAEIGFGADFRLMIVIIWRSPFFVAENETEVSFFNRELYEAFKANPEVGLANVCFFLLFADTIQTRWD